jgi:serine phosphatase RsbU (regulator of sigma subunit)
MSWFKKTSLFLFGWSLTLLISAQPQLPPIGNFSPRDYGDGQVPENYAICKDDRGFIYSANIGGLLQFDGHEWKLIEVESGVKINALAYSGNNQIAYGGLNLMGIVEPNKKGELEYTSLVSLLPDSLKNFEIITIQSLENKIFFQSKFVLFVYENKRIKPVFPEVSFFRTYSCNNRVFVRDRQIGLKEWKNGKFEIFASDTISKNWGYFGMVDYSSTHFLLAEHELGFYFMNKKSGKIEIVGSFFFDDFSPKVYDLKKLDHDLYAIATGNHGVVILDKDLELKARISRNDGLKSSLVNQLTIDNSGNIWAATSAGISFIDIHSPLHFYGEISGLPGNIESIQRIGSHFYAGSSDGLFILPEFFNDNYTPWRKVEGINSLVNSLDVNERDILVATGNGLFFGTLQSFTKISQDNYHTVKYIPGLNQIVALTPDKLEIYNNDYKKIKEFPLGIHVQRSHSVSFDTSVINRTRIWMGLGNQGVLRLDVNNSGEYQFILFNQNDGLMPGIVKPFNFIGKTIFLTENGFQHFISEEEISGNLSEEEKADPLINRGYFDAFKIPGKDINGKISAMYLDNGRIYLILNDHLCYFDEKGKKHQKEFSTLSLGRLNDLICFKNQLWISASEGAAEFNPFHFKKLDHPFKIYFRKISGKNGFIYMNEFFSSENKTSKIQNSIPEINYSDNSLVFVFSTDYFDHTKKMEYAFKLEGQEMDWSKWSKENKISFNNLSEGDYELRVKARNIYGVESNIAVFKFTVLPPWYRTWWAYVLYFVLAVLIILITIRIAVYRLKQSNLRLEKTVKDRTFEIATKNEELQEQNHQILHQKQEITDSINYAKRIQEAILPIQKEIKKVFPDSFVLFKPKDIVSGDFYWFSHQNNLSIFICADCTGHGVPGAFMSMICTDRINHTVLEKKILSPSALLKEVNQGIKRSLKQEDETDLKTKDGMDNAVCSFNHQTSELTYAGANRPLWLLRANSSEIIEYKPTKMAVGGFTPEEQHFEETIIKIEKGDIIYLSTDGYADQFGGPKGKKLMVKTFKETLVQFSSLSFEEQHNRLDKFIEDWRNTKTNTTDYIEQVDDMCIVGIRF